MLKKFIKLKDASGAPIFCNRDTISKVMIKKVQGCDKYNIRITQLDKSEFIIDRHFTTSDEAISYVQGVLV